MNAPSTPDALLHNGAMRAESRDGRYAVIDLARSETPLKTDITDYDKHPLWLNTPAGTLDLETGRMHDHRIDDLLTKVTGASYGPEATCPTWERFLEEVLPDPEVRAFMQRSVGYALTDVTVEQCLWLLWGKGRNGKSTFINTLRAVLGDYAASTQASTLMVKAHGDGKLNDIAVLRGARLVSATEAEEGQQLAEALLKQMTGED